MRCATHAQGFACTGLQENLRHAERTAPLVPSPAGGWLAGETRCVPAAPLAYDTALAAQLWDLSADACKLPRQPRVVGSK